MEPYEKVDPKTLGDHTEELQDLKHHNLDWILVSSDLQNIPAAKVFRPRRRVYYIPDAHGWAIENSRQRRKNRHFEFVHDDTYWKRFTSVPSLLRLLALDLQNISWHVAAWFTLGSAAWIVNGHIVLWPIDGNAESTTSVDVVGYSALVGGLMFWLGAYLAVVEALNEDMTSDYEVALRNVMSSLHKEGKDVEWFVLRRLGPMESEMKNIESGEKSKCHVAKLEVSRRKIGPKTPDVSLKEAAKEVVKAPAKLTVSPRSGWRWFGVESSSYGWWASMIQFTGATAFSVAVITGIPGVLASSQWVLSTLLIWTMQVIGSICFILSSAMLLMEEQRKWYIPALDRIGWHSSFWNLIGSIGFLLSASFGYLTNWRGRGTVCCFFWGVGFNTYYGSWAFLISSLLMLIEVQNKELTSLDKHIARLWAWIAVRSRCDSPSLDSQGSSKVESSSCVADEENDGLQA